MEDDINTQEKGHVHVSVLTHETSATQASDDPRKEVHRPLAGSLCHSSLSSLSGKRESSVGELNASRDASILNASVPDGPRYKHNASPSQCWSVAHGTLWPIRSQRPQASRYCSTPSGAQSDEVSTGCLDSKKSNYRLLESLLLWSGRKRSRFLAFIRRKAVKLPGSGDFNWLLTYWVMVDDIGKRYLCFSNVCIVMSIVVVIGVIAMMLFLLIIPSLIQKHMNATEIKLISSVVTNPQASQFDLSFIAQLERQTSIPFKVNEFEASLFYTPVHIPSTNAPVRGLQDGVPFSFNPEFSSEFSSELGRIHIPSIALKGKMQSIHPATSTQVMISDANLFSVFLKDLVHHGMAIWTMRGFPSGGLAGIRYRHIHFEKQLSIRGPKLFMINEEGSQTKTNPFFNSSAPYGPHSSANDVLRVISVDLTESTPVLAVIRVQVALLNSGASITLDPLGSLSFMLLYHQQYIAVLTTESIVILRPQENILSLNGTIEPLNAVSDPRRHRALSSLFTQAMKGEPLQLTMRGINSSIPLFSPAIQAIDITCPFQLFNVSFPQRREANVEVLQSNPQSKSIIRSLRIHTVQLFETMLNAQVNVEIKGVLHVSLGNPFGSNTQLFVQHAQLGGVMGITEYKLPTSGDVQKNNISGIWSETPATEKVSNSVHRVVGNITGKLSQQHRGWNPNVTHSEQLGALRVEVQDIALAIDLVLDFSENRNNFYHLIRNILTSSEVALALIDATLNLDVITPLGALLLTEVPVAHHFTIPGFSNMQGLTVKSVSIGAKGEEKNYSERIMMLINGPVATIVAEIPPSQQLGLYVGALALDITYEGRHLVNVVAEHCEVNPSEPSPIEFSGKIIPEETTWGLMLQVYSRLQIRKRITLKGTFVAVNSVNHSVYDDSPLWLRNALYGVSIDININDDDEKESDKDHVAPKKVAPNRVRDMILSGLDQLLSSRSQNDALKTNISSIETHRTESTNATSVPQPGRGSLLLNFLNGLQRHRVT